MGGIRVDIVGYKAEDRSRFRRAITKPYGMVMVKGHNGSGKTTKLYAAINEVPPLRQDNSLTQEGRFSEGAQSRTQVTCGFERTTVRNKRP